MRICFRNHRILSPARRVITVAPMPPGRSAYALARYSRSPDSIRDSVEWVRTHDSQEFLANSAARPVIVLNVATGDRTAVACDCAPAGLVPMGNLLRMTELCAWELWLLDSGGRDPRMVFVPAATVQ
jgi:hypothetical protein